MTQYLDEPMSLHDDSSALRYVLHTVKGISPVSGGVLGDALEAEYESAEEQTRVGEALDFEGDI